jgi:hypothetical protein
MLFGDAPLEMDVLAQTLLERVRPIAKAVEERNPQSSPTPWTRAVYQVLRELGCGLGFDVYSCLPDCHGEWLFDTVWKRKTGDLALVAESEWAQATKEILYDFRKVLIAKAPIKLLVYDGGDEECCSQSIRNAIEECMEAYSAHVPGESYLLVSFGPTSQYAHSFTVHDGVVPSIKFTSVGRAFSGMAAH